ncbi:MAG: hypothetical protein Kow00121_02200 [Elainellaceae cyanobacterium]
MEMGSQPSPDQLLTPEECAEVDQAMMTSRDRFSARVAIYSLRSLKAVAEQNGTTIAQLGEQQIVDWVNHDPTLRPENGFDSSFKGFFAKLVLSSLKPLRQIALENEQAIDDLTVSQVVSWFEKAAKARIEQGESTSFLG